MVKSRRGAVWLDGNAGKAVHVHVGGAMAKSAGLSGSQIVDMSTDLAGLAADMASFYNLDFDTAFQKIRSGISGETEPLKQLGINMSVANLNAFALQQGLDRTFEKMTQGEQTMLRYQYIMSATADAQGDFARTSDGYANSMRRLETNVNAIKTALGQSFLGIVGEAVNGLNGFLELLIPKDNSTVLDDFANIDLKTDKLGVKSEKTAAYLASLGLSTDDIDKKESKWLETCKRLVKVLPGLNEIINTETGEVKGGTQAVKDYIDAWEKGQHKLVMLGALQEKNLSCWVRCRKRKAHFRPGLPTCPALNWTWLLPKNVCATKRKKWTPCGKSTA